jgi:hypothetical protein
LLVPRARDAAAEPPVGDLDCSVDAMLKAQTMLSVHRRPRFPAGLAGSGVAEGNASKSVRPVSEPES